MSHEPNMGKWITASLAKLLEPVVAGLNIEYYVEGISKEIEKAFTEDSALLRVNGPVYYDWPGCDLYKVEAFVMLTDLERTNDGGYDLHVRAGQIADALSQSIPIYRHGDEDPATLVGCLQKDRDSREFVRTVNYGLIEKDMLVKQMAVLARFELELSS